jgi:ubiquinone/menaquinone biosynthesis C-methylase UbiE
MMTINSIVQEGFTRGAAAYERGRPDYPTDAVALMAEQLGLRAGATVVDVGAGTGKLSRLLAGTGARVIAVEPVAAMRDQFRRVLPDITILDGAAETIALADGAADAITAAQAFHWFANAKALAEMHRVLKAGGRLGLIWNKRDIAAGWVKDVWALIDRAKHGAPSHRTDRWKKAFDEFQGFRPISEKSFDYTQKVDFELLTDRIASTSFVANMDEVQRARLLREVREVIDSHPAARGKQMLDIPYRTDVYIYEAA